MIREMNARADMDLLRDYLGNGSEETFRLLVDRHVDLVYSAALRQVWNPHLAQEITQAVFLVLLRKAPTLSPNTILAAWLYRTARFAAADALKAQRRRTKYEQEAARMKAEPHDSEPAWDSIAPLLDEAMAQLGEQDRAALLLRFFENKSLREVGAALGSNDDSAQKRVSRALAKLRDFFTRRGVVVPIGAIGSLLLGHAVQAAPAGIAASIASGAAAATLPPSTTTLIHSILKMILWKKIQTAATTTALLLLAAGTVTVVAQKTATNPNGAPPPPPAVLPAPAPAPPPQADRTTPIGALRFLAEALAAYDGPRVVESYFTPQPAEQHFIQAMARVVTAEGRLKKAVDARFGEQPMREALASRGAPLLSFYFGQDGLDDAKLQIEGDRATVTLPDAREPGKDNQLELRRTGALWQVYAGEANEQASKKAAMFDSIANAILGLSSQVDEGKFSQFSEVMRALRKGVGKATKPAA